MQPRRGRITVQPAAFAAAQTNERIKGTHAQYFVASSPTLLPCNRIFLMQESNRRYMLWQDCQMDNRDELSVKTGALRRALGVQGERAGVVRI